MSGFEWLRARRNGLAREFAWPLVANLFKLLPAQSYRISGANGPSELWQYAGSSKNPYSGWRVMVIAKYSC